MAKDFEDGVPGTESETDKGNAGVSERSEREVEAAAGSELDDDDEEGKEQRAADDTGDADPAKAVVGLRKRLAKLTAQRNQARDRAAERDALADKVAAYEKRERDAEEMLEAARRRTPEGQKAEERRRAVRDTIDEAYPGASDYLDSVQEERHLRIAKYAQDGISYLKSELADHGIEATPETTIRYERAVGSEMAEDPELLAAYKHPATQKDAIVEAFSRVRDGIVNPVLKQRGAKALARIERNREAVLGSGDRGAMSGTPEPEFDLKPPKGLQGRELDEWWATAREKYWQKLTAQEGA